MRHHVLAFLQISFGLPLDYRAVYPEVFGGKVIPRKNTFLEMYHTLNTVDSFIVKLVIMPRPNEKAIDC